MGRAFAAPLPDGLRRRLAAAGLALAVNLGFLALLILLPHPVFMPVEPAAIDVVLVTPPPPPPPPPAEQAPTPVERPAPEPADPAPAETETALPAEPVAAEPVDAVREEDQEEDENRPAEAAPPAWAEPGAAAGEAQPFPSGPGSTGYAVREIFCLSTSDANRDAMNCPPSDGREGLPLLQYASPENIARAQAAFAGLDLDPDQIRALFEGRGLPVRDLEGQPTLADPRARTTSTADQMRNTLPPLHPDPGFGD